MRDKTWLMIIGIAVITLVIAFFAGWIVVKEKPASEPATSASASEAKAVFKNGEKTGQAAEEPADGEKTGQAAEEPADGEKTGQAAEEPADGEEKQELKKEE